MLNNEMLSFRGQQNKKCLSPKWGINKLIIITDISEAAAGIRQTPRGVGFDIRLFYAPEKSK
jgi:hypothetical protein